jgi:hypothetical protein
MYVREICGLTCGQPSEEDVNNVRHTLNFLWGKVPTVGLWKVREYKYEWDCRKKEMSCEWVVNVLKWIVKDCERVRKFVREIVECLYIDSSDQSYVLTNDNRIKFVKTESIQSHYIRESAKNKSHEENL